MESYRVIGIMSGTSLDGVDLAFCEFQKSVSWSFRIHQGVTVPFNAEWKTILSGLHQAGATEYARFHVVFGRYLGSLARNMLWGDHLIPDFIASHGHTIFHQPAAGFTAQIGDGAALAVTSGFPVVCDFRSADVAFGGQGAPLVPIGDRLLFSGHSNCLNLGGIANISFEKNKQRLAFDICPCNMILNRLASRKGMEYDAGGQLASEGKVNEELLAGLNQLPYYASHLPKSLGREEVDQSVWPVLESSALPVEDQLATFCEHIARQIAGVGMPGDLFITGGGAFNTYLVRRIQEVSGREVVVPDSNLINYKEAMIFAFLGVLRWRNEVNCLRSVTGASRDSSGGAIYFP